MRRNVPPLRYRLAALALELIGTGAVLAAVAQVSWPVALALGGILAVVVALLLDRGDLP